MFHCQMVVFLHGEQGQYPFKIDVSLLCLPRAFGCLCVHCVLPSACLLCSALFPLRVLRCWLFSGEHVPQELLRSWMGASVAAAAIHALLPSSSSSNSGRGLPQLLPVLRPILAVCSSSGRVQPALSSSDALVYLPSAAICASRDGCP